MKKKFILLFFLVLSYSFANAGVKETKFPNGLTALLEENHNLPIVSIQLWVKVGSRDEDTSVSGISHLIEHMVFKGTQEYPGEAVQNEIEKRGGVINAGTSKDFTYFYIALPTQMDAYFKETSSIQVDQNYLSIGLNILFQMLRKAEFPEDELEREKLVIIEEINRNLDNPRSYIWDLFNSTLYAGHPYSQPVLGTSESVQNISREDIINYYNKFYILSNCTLVIIGDFKEKDAITQIKKQMPVPSMLLRATEGSVAIQNKTGSVTTTFSQRQVKKPVHQVYLMLGTTGPDVIEKDCYSMDIISYILGKGRYSRLYRKLHEEKELVWSIDCSFLTQKEKGPFFIYIECDADKIPLVKEVLFQELNRISNELVTDDEIKRAKSLFESEYLLGIQTYQGEAFNLGYYQTISSYKIGVEYLDKVLKVSAADINRVAKKYLTLENFNSVMIVPEE